MTTERDVYELDTSSAVDSLGKLEKAYDEVVGGVRKALPEITAHAAGVALGQAAYDGLKKAISGAVELLKESAQAALEAQQVDAKLATSIKNAGYDVEVYTKKLGDQAAALERLTGRDDEYYKSLQTLMITLGVAPNEVDRFTRAALDLAAATGTDATMAAKLLARAHAEGKDELKKYGISVDEAAFKAKGFGAVLGEVEKRFGGMHEQIPDQMKDINRMKGAWESFKETLGASVLKFVETHDLASKIVALIDGANDMFTPEAQKKFNALSKDEQRKALEAERQTLLDHLSGQKTLWEVYTGEVETSIAVPFEKAQEMLAALEKKLAPDWLKTIDAVHVPKNRPIVSDEDKKANDKKLKEAQDYLDQKDKLFNERADNLMKDGKLRDAEEIAATGAKIAALGDLGEEEANEYRANQAAKYEWEHQLATEAEEKRQNMRDKQVAQEKAFYENLLSELEGYAKRVLDFGLSLLQEQLTQNETYNKAYHEALVNRRIADSEEQGAKKTAVEVEKELASEAKATQDKKTAEFLAGIAKEAAMQAILEGAKAIASLAAYDYPGAAQHGIAAAAFGGVALAAGGAAAALSAGRGMTREEKDSIESLNKRKEEKAARDSNVTTGTAQGPGVQQNVYFFGISGMTEISQGAELERLRRKHDNLSTGA